MISDVWWLDSLYWKTCLVRVKIFYMVSWNLVFDFSYARSYWIKLLILIQINFLKSFGHKLITNCVVNILFEELFNINFKLKIFVTCKFLLCSQTNASTLAGLVVTLGGVGCLIGKIWHVQLRPVHLHYQAIQRKFPCL